MTIAEPEKKPGIADVLMARLPGAGPMVAGPGGVASHGPSGPFMPPTRMPAPRPGGPVMERLPAPIPGKPAPRPGGPIMRPMPARPGMPAQPMPAPARPGTPIARPMPRPQGGMPASFMSQLNPAQRQDFAALSRNTGGNFANMGGQAGLMRRYGLRQAPQMGRLMNEVLQRGM